MREQRVYISMHSRGEEGSRVVVFNRSYLENGIFKQSNFFTVHQKQYAFESYTYFNHNMCGFLLMIFQRSVVLLSDLACILRFRQHIGDTVWRHTLITWHFRVVLSYKSVLVMVSWRYDVENIFSINLRIFSNQHWRPNGGFIHCDVLYAIEFVRIPYKPII